MGLFSKFTKFGIAKKLYDEARKPENRRKAREAYQKFRASRRSKQG